MGDTVRCGGEDQPRGAAPLRQRRVQVSREIFSAKSQNVLQQYLPLPYFLTIHNLVFLFFFFFVLPASCAASSSSRRWQRFG